MERLYNYLIEFGFSKEDVDRVVNNYALLRYNPDTLLNNIIRNNNYLLEVGFSKSQIRKMTKRLPQIYDISITNIEEKIAYLEELGFTKEQIIRMGVNFSAIFGCRKH